jgi:hypothetical protein
MATTVWVVQLPSSSRSPIYSKVAKNGKSHRRKQARVATTYASQNAAQTAQGNLKHHPSMRDGKVVQVTLP